MIAAVDKRTGGACDLQERAERGQFKAPSRQLLDRGIDDVGQVVAAARDLDRRNRRCLARGQAVGGNADVVAHERHRTLTVTRRRAVCSNSATASPNAVAAAIWATIIGGTSSGCAKCPSR